MCVLSHQINEVAVKVNSKTTRGLPLHSLEAVWFWMAGGIFCKDASLEYFCMCAKVWNSASLSLESSKPCPGGPSLGLVSSPLAHKRLIFKKRVHAKINKTNTREPNWKTYLLWGSVFTQRYKQNQCSKKASDFLCSISQVNHDHSA